MGRFVSSLLLLFAVCLVGCGESGPANVADGASEQQLQDYERMIQEVFGATTPVSQTAAAPAAFPSPTVQPQEAGGFAPPPQPVAAGAIRRTKTPSPADDPYWDMLVANPSSFWDNREGKLNPSSPDFKLKVDKGATPEEKREAKALWLNTCPDRHMAHFGVVA